VAFTGGDLTCCPDFYGESARLIKAHTKLWVMIETNGYGLTPENLEYLKQSGVDAFWLDIKAYDPEKHNWLTGCSNDRILGLPEEIVRKGFVLEVLSLFIPEVVEIDDLRAIARILKRVDPETPFTILAFFPEYEMKGYRSPTATEMVEAYQAVKAEGMINIRLGNVGLFARSENDWRTLENRVDQGAY
jgi:pyruvate-formate lyase-activating enzyme